MTGATDAVVVPQCMADCLDCDDPIAALQALADASATRSSDEADRLKAKLEAVSLTTASLPEILLSHQRPDHPLNTLLACAESVHGSLSKIASGGSQASQEIRKLEQEKRDLDQHAEAVATALTLRQHADRASQSLAAAAYHDAAEAVKIHLEVDLAADPRIAEYAGEYSLQLLRTTYAKLKDILLEQYEQAVKTSNLQTLGQLTPVLSTLRLEHEGLRLYKVYLQSILESSLQTAAATATSTGTSGHNKDKKPPPYAPMGQIYNTAVAMLRHHLPMVSHCLYKADGAAAVVQLVHVQTESTVMPLLNDYQRSRQLTKVAATATDVYNALTEQPETDCGFAARIGTLADTDVAMDELAKCLQTTEAYLRFMQQTCTEVNKSRKVRFEQTAQQMRLERERHEYKTGEKLPEPEMTYHDMMILPATTPLHELVAELGGQYAAIERCLMLAAMQKAFVQSEEAIESPRSYRPMSTGDALSEDCLQTTLVDSILLSARRGMQRAFATGHVGTASAMTNFTVDTLTEAISDVLVRRAEDLGVHRLRPGEGLLVGTANLFNNAMMIRQGTTTVKEELVKKRKVAEGIARACSVLNDLEVAAHHTTQLEQLLTTTIEKGYPPAAHEQLKMVVKSLEGVAASFKLAANSTMDSLESVLKPRIRSIVGEAVGGSEAATFMGASTVMASAADRDRMVRMNYDLDDDAYDMMQLSESYISRMCSLIDELLGQLRRYLAPRLWDTLLLMVLSTACKRLETSLKKCEFTSLGAIAMDADMRDLVNFAKENLNDATTVHKGCPALSRLQQIARLLSVDDVADVPDLIASAKRQGGWDLKNEEVKSFLGARVEFDPAKINQTLRLPKDD